MDTGLIINLISPNIAKQINLTLFKTNIPNIIKLANFIFIFIFNYIYLDFNMEEIICPIIF